ncbi:hypothetical protein RND81_04G246100 [Saponaria officinalis]|uniref:Trichome birefringence-like N-terminal domain-containing protein n=1 Tax=Saponaria officinalis TaxID=3572 RepID=A0AAW1LHB5_SAPOF
MADHSLPVSKPSNLLPFSHPRKTLFFAYGFMLIFLISTLFILFNPSLYSSSSSSPWLLHNLVYFRSPSFFSSFFSHHFPDSGINASSSVVAVPPTPSSSDTTNVDASHPSHSSNISSAPEPQKSGDLIVKSEKEANESKGSIVGCNLFEGEWVRDESYPLYAPGSCPHIDEPFNCFLNHRPDNDYEKYRWQPHGCNIPRLNGTDMLELLRGKRMVFVGDSLNRNMWESLVCVLRNSVEDKSRVFEASGREEFRSEGSYSFIFHDYNCSVEFFKTNFLVQEWEMPDKNGSKKETLRLDLVESSSDRFKDADVLIFNTGHWWSHDKTTRGQDYYQEGSHVYRELNVMDAFRRALTTWARWVEANVDPKKAQIFFRGYSASHFGGGEWNTGGKCDKETKPFTDETYSSSFFFNTEVLEDVLKWMKTPVFYLNITRLSDYRIDAHPSIYRGQQLTDEERRSPLRYQDCSHWCLPGVPDIWNELVYSQLLVRHHQRLEEEQQREQLHRKKS